MPIAYSPAAGSSNLLTTGSPPAAAAANATLQDQIAWLGGLADRYNSAYTLLVPAAANALKDMGSWQAEAAATSDATAAAALTQAYDDMLALQSDVQTTVLDPNQGLAGLNIAQRTRGIAALLNELASSRALLAELQALGILTASGQIVLPSAPAAGAVKTSTAVVSTAAGTTIGAVLGGLVGHAIGAGLLFAGEARESPHRRKAAGEEEEEEEAAEKPAPRRRKRSAR